MKKVILGLSLISIICLCSCDPYHLNNWWKTVDNKNPDVVFMGDSITAYADWDELLPNTNSYNIAVPGHIITNTRDYIPRLKALNPKTVFVMVGINNYVNSDYEWERDYTELLTLLKSIENNNLLYKLNKVYIQSMLPTRDDFACFNDKTLSRNKWLKDKVESFGFTYLDIHPLFLDDDGETLKKEYSLDGIHLTQDGFETWATFLKDNCPEIK
ncbi:MAG: hypothetical protein HUJ61_04885 [Bacilli bacterium]|nr:hypothetical protein [Bacilli bacterium]